MKASLVFLVLALFAMAAAFPQGVNVVDNNNPGQVNFVDNSNPSQDKCGVNRPTPVHFVDNNNPGQVHVVDNNPGGVHVVDNNPGAVDSAYYRPGAETPDISPAFVQRPRPPGKVYDNPYLRGGK